MGAKAAWLTEHHPFQYGYGPGTPFEKLVEVYAKILMLGAPLDTITLLHYAEHLADIPEKQIVQYRHLMPTETGPQWIDFEEFDTSEPVNSQLPENVFEQIAESFLKSGQGTKTSFGQTSAFLLESNELIPFAKQWLEDYFPG
ncbi:MAG: AAC(3) family N-acetyltransferase [Acidobacteria bacterium]|nr:AAC(3) family N-acetyltransferase [Acidobacteriota bacterium]